MRGLKQYIQRPARPERPSQADYNRAHWFLYLVQKSTILSVQDKNELRYKALHGELQEAQQIYEDIVAGRTTP